MVISTIIKPESINRHFSKLAGLLFHSVGNFIIPADELTPSFFRGVGLNQPPTSNY